MYKIKYLETSQADLENIFNYILEDNSFYAYETIIHIRKIISYLKNFPYIGGSRNNGNYRVLVDPKYKYKILYKINGNIIEIVSISKNTNSF